MQLGIFAKTFEGKSAGVVLPQVKAAGFNVAQYNMACSGLNALPDEVSSSVIAELRKAVATTGITLSALSATYNMAHPEKIVRQQGHKRLSIVAEAASKLNIPLVTLCTGSRDAEDQWRYHPDNASNEAWRDMIESMEIAIDIANCFNIDLGIEPELANVVSNAKRAKKLIDECKSPRLKIVLDAANLFETTTLEQQRDIISEAIDLLGPNIAMAHAKDRDADGAFVAAGTGVLDYPHFLSALKKVGFKGPLVTHGLSAKGAPSVAAFLRQQLRDVGIEATA